MLSVDSSPPTNGLFSRTGSQHRVDNSRSVHKMNYRMVVVMMMMMMMMTVWKIPYKRSL